MMLFRNCTIMDDTQPYLKVPLDMNGIPCYPGDFLSDGEMIPIEVAGIWAFDDGDSFVEGVVDHDGIRYISSKLYHCSLD